MEDDTCRIPMNRMPLRDWFAGLAMQSLIRGTLAGASAGGHLMETMLESIPVAAYSIAGAMLKERDRNQEAPTDAEAPKENNQKEILRGLCSDSLLSKLNHRQNSIEAEKRKEKK